MHGLPFPSAFAKAPKFAGDTAIVQSLLIQFDALG